MQETIDLFQVLSNILPQSPPHAIKLELTLTNPRACVAAGRGPDWALAMADLLRNAAVVTPADRPIEVSLRATQEELELEVIDHGCGIEPEDFEAVTQGPALDRVRQVVRGAGGAMVVRSTGRGMGSLVRIIVPTVMRAADPAPTPTDTHAPPPPDANPDAHVRVY